MPHRPLLLSCCAVALALPGAGCGTGAALQTEAPLRLQTSAVVWACGQTRVVRPRSLIIACGDGNTALAGLRWRDWGADTATADGRAVVNPCVPNCAAGHQLSYPVDVTVSGLVIGAHYAAYGTVTMTAPGHHPRGTPRRLTFPLETSGPGGRS